jgi:acyl-CoA reductase-like NAD-dependent aldehyde dehydrogenase
LIWKLAQLVRREKDVLIALECADNGKPHCLASVDIEMVAESLEFFAGGADKITGKTYMSGDPSVLTSFRREPYGVVGLISPWNYPLLMADWKLAPALAAGCTIVLKASEETPLTSLKFAELVKEAGFPPGVFNVVNGYGHIAGEYLIRHPLVKKVFLI